VTGREGLLKAATEPYNAIVLDRGLPSGIAVVRDGSSFARLF
jgi:hypothetical protein